MADNPAPEEVQVDPHPSTPLERIRYVPEWEVPVNPPKRPFFSPAKLSKTLKRSRLAAAIRPKQRSSPRSSFTPGSNESLHKEGSLVAAGGILPTAHSTFSVRTAPPSAYHETLSSRLRRRLDATLPPHHKYLCGLTRATCIVLFAALTLIVLALALGLGLGLGLRGRTSGPRELPLPDGGRKSYNGELTYYSPGLGACGLVSAEGEAICAVAWELFDAASPSGGNPNNNPLCKKRIRVTRNLDGDPSRGNFTVDVMVVDRCTGCKPTDLDLSPSVFNQLAQQDKGRVRGTWQWLEE